MTILTWILLAFLCGLFASKVLDIFKTLLEKLQYIRLEIGLGSDGELAHQARIQQGEVNSTTPKPSIREAGSQPALKPGLVLDKNANDKPAPQ